MPREVLASRDNKLFLRLAKKADEPASKAETEGSFEGEVASKEPSAEEPASEKSSGCVAS